MPISRQIARVLAGAAGTHLGLRLGSRTRAWVGPFQVTASLTTGREGGTLADIAPLGTARIRTHGGPLCLTATATVIDPARAEGLLRMPDDEADAAGLRDELDRALESLRVDAKQLGAKLAARSAVSGVAGAAGLAALTLRRPRDVVGAAAAGAVVLAGGAAVAGATRRKDPWRDPQLTGLLTRAPLILGDLRTAPQRIGLYRDQLADLLRTATAVYRRVVELPGPPPQDAIRLLHVSDIHLSPAAFPLVRVLVDEYRVDAVIDTGDLVDWGTPAESAFAGQIAGLGVPYIFIKGNHDSDGIAAAVARQPNATVLDGSGRPVEIAGLRLVGTADPRFTPDKTTGDDDAPEKVLESAEALAAEMRAVGEAADIALVHDPAAGQALAGLVPLVLAGHTHERSVQNFGTTLVIVQGSSGGAGLRGVQADPPTPISLSVLYIDRATRLLDTVDEVTLGGIGLTEVQVSRRRAAELLDEAGP